MPDPNPVTQNTAGNVTPAAPVSKPTVPSEPAKQAQPTPGAQPGVTPKPEGDKDQAQTVPLATLIDERSKRQALEAEVALMKQQLSAPSSYQQQQQPPVNQMAMEIDKLWDTDPRKGVQAEIMMAMDWYDRTNNSIDQQADVLSGKYTDFNQWRSNATKYVRSLPLQQRSQPGVLEMAYFIVRGQNVDDILKRQNDDLMAKFQTGELAGMVSTPPGAVGSPAPRSGVQLSEEQRAAAAAMGVPEEEYVKYIKPGAR